MAAEWFYQAMGQELGPIEPAELRRRADRGIVKPDTPIRKGADGPWVRAEQIQGFFEQPVSRAAASPAEAEVRPAPGPPPAAPRYPCGTALPPPPRAADLPPRTPPIPKCGTPSKSLIGDSPIRPCPPPAPADASPDKPDRIHPVTWAAIFVGAGSVLLLLWALVFRGGSAPQQQAKVHEPAADPWDEVTRGWKEAPAGTAVAPPPPQGAPDVPWNQWQSNPSDMRGRRLGIPPPSPAPAKPVGEPVAETLTPKQLYAKVSPAVMHIVARNSESDEIGSGTGFLVTSDGLLVTNWHVINDGFSASARVAGGREYIVEGVVATDKDADLAVLKINGTDLPTLKLGNGVLPAVGTKVFAIGNPLGLENTLSEGLISGHRPASDGLPGLQTTAAISGGSSGGPLLDETGTVVGVITLFLKGGQNLNFAIPVALVKSLIDRRGPVAALTSAGDASAYYYRGEAYYAKGDFDRAIAEYTEAIRLEPKHFSAYYFRGGAYASKRDYVHAIADYSEAIRLDPKNARAYYYRGGAYYAKGDFDRAIAEYTEAIRLNPQFAAAYYFRGFAYSGKGDYDRAIAEYTEAIRLDPTYALAYKNRGSAYEEKGDYDRAIADYSEAIRLDPTDASVYRLRAYRCSLKGDYDSAIADYTEVIRRNPKDAQAYQSRGREYEKKGDLANAKKDVSQAFKLAYKRRP